MDSVTTSVSLPANHGPPAIHMSALLHWYYDLINLYSNDQIKEGSVKDVFIWSVSTEMSWIQNIYGMTRVRPVGKIRNVRLVQ